MSAKTQTFTAEEIRLGPRADAVVTGAAIVGLAGIGASIGLGYFGGDAARAQFFTSYLVSFCYFLSLCLGALFFVLIQHLTRAGWSVVVRRIAEVVAANVAVMAVLAIPIVLGVRELYEWADPAALAGLPLVQKKTAYLNVPFFLIRLAIVFGAWILLTQFFLRKSVEQDRTGDPALTTTMQKIAAPGTFVFAITLTFAAFDLLMSLEAEWFSTMFGVYFFAGSIVSFFAFLPILASRLQNAGRLVRVITTEHYHDLGKLVFAFTVFWAYIAFSQYMLIWYANLPEETNWFLRRQTGEWTNVSWFLLIGHFAVPFLGLVSRSPKRRRPTLVFASAWVLFMHWVDLYYLVKPHTSDGRIPLGILDLTCFIGLGGVFVAALAFQLKGVALIPEKDPRLAESLAFENF